MMKVYYTNANGLMNKINELRLTILSKDIDIACVTETHFSSNLYEGETEIIGYNCFRQDRNFKLNCSKGKDAVSCGGGSVIYVRNTIAVDKISNVTGNLDSVAILIECDLGKVLLSCMYRSPSLSLNQDEKLFKCFNTLTNYGDKTEKIFLGDFNFSDVSWLSGSVLGSVESVNSSLQIQRKYVDVIHNAGLNWLLTDQITRRRIVSDEVQESLLDQVLCTEESLINDFEIGPPLGKSDHVSLIFELNMCGDGVNDSSIDVEKHNWSKVNNLDVLKLASNIDWAYSKDIAVLSVEDMWQELHSKLHLVTKGVPLVNPAPNGMNKCNMPWANSSVKRAFKAKNKAWGVFDEDPCRVNLNLALEKQEVFENLECKAKVKFESKLTKDLKSNSKGFYAYIRNSRKVKSVVTSLERADGSRTETDKDTAECFSEAFSSVFVHEPLGPLPKECYLQNSRHENVCSPMTISEEDVYSQLKKLNIYKSMGPDDVHPKLLKCLSEDSNFVRNLTLLCQNV